jgi:hypothetical protein
MIPMLKPCIIEMPHKVITRMSWHAHVFDEVEYASQAFIHFFEVLITAGFGGGGQGIIEFFSGNLP